MKEGYLEGYFETAKFTMHFYHHKNASFTQFRISTVQGSTNPIQNQQSYFDYIMAV